MINLLLFVSLFGVILAGPVPQESAVEPTLGTGESNIIYWFYSKKSPSSGTSVNTGSIAELAKTSFSASKDTMFIVHGWRNTMTSPFITTVRDVIVKNLDVNLFVVDWSEIAAQNYNDARRSVKNVGNSLASFIEKLVSTYGIKLSQTSLVGHSLGAHVVGNAGSALKGAIAIIVGLDPAYPFFWLTNEGNRLDSKDAQFVQVIHTNGGLKGFLPALGNADYYPNGGSRQPGCGLDLTGSCAHARAYQYYAESLSTGGFKARSCSSYSDYTKGKCDSAKISFMGTYKIDRSASGKYYLETNSKPLYAKG